MAGLIKSIDPIHLVSLGTISGECGSSVGDYAYINAGPNIDVMDWHDYGPNNDGLAHPDLPLGLDDVNNGFTVSRDRATANGKVFIVGEIGIHWMAIDPPTRAYRASLLDAKLSAQFAAGSQGELLWCWADAPVSDDPARDYEFVPGDPALAMLTRH
jgi:endo-1,4-beta-mannosidase